MSENIQSISQGTYTIGQTSATNFVAGPGISITEPSAGTVRIGTDETVLFAATGTSIAGNVTCSESISNFDKIEITYALSTITNSIWSYSPVSRTFPVTGIMTVKQISLSDLFPNGNNYNQMVFRDLTYSAYESDNTTKFNKLHCTQLYYNGSSWAVTEDPNYGITKIVGINRISGSNA